MIINLLCLFILYDINFIDLEKVYCRKLFIKWIKYSKHKRFLKKCSFKIILKKEIYLLTKTYGLWIIVSLNNIRIRQKIIKFKNKLELKLKWKCFFAYLKLFERKYLIRTNKRDKLDAKFFLLNKIKSDDMIKQQEIYNIKLNNIRTKIQLGLRINNLDELKPNTVELKSQYIYMQKWAKIIWNAKIFIKLFNSIDKSIYKRMKIMGFNKLKKYCIILKIVTCIQTLWYYFIYLYYN